jgi:hypothetical protein
MRWFRSHIRFGSRLALAALAVQLILTFGHVHLDGIAQDFGKSALSVLANRSSTTVADASNPAHKSNGPSDPDCPICALIQLASTSAPSVAPVLPVPAGFVVFRPEVASELEWVASSYFSFQARGPPSI